MKFVVHLRDGAQFSIEASYIEVVDAPESSYTFLGPVPGFPTAILAAFPIDVVTAILPAAPPGAQVDSAAGRVAPA